MLYYRQDKYLFWLDWQKRLFDWKGCRIVGICTIRSFILQGHIKRLQEFGLLILIIKQTIGFVVSNLKGTICQLLTNSCHAHVWWFFKVFGFLGPFNTRNPGFVYQSRHILTYRYPLLIIISHAHLLQDQLFAFDLKLMCIQLCYYAH